MIFNLNKFNDLIEGICDGLTIDSKGNLWIAVFGVSKVINIDPRKPDTLLGSLNFPAKYVSIYLIRNKNGLYRVAW